MSDSDANRSLTLTSTKKWKYVPGKKYDLCPLNLKDIRKQLLDTSNEESEDSENDEANSEETKISEILNESFNDGSSTLSNLPENPPLESGCDELEEYLNDKNLYKICDKNVDKPSVSQDDHNEKLNHHKFASFSTSLETVSENPVEGDNIIYTNHAPLACENKENMGPLNLSREKSRNDSFDLDFSALSINTPVKKVEKNFNYVTPKINIIPPSHTKSNLKTVPLFRTPIVANKQYLFKTPVSKPLLPASYSINRPQRTPYSAMKNSARYNMMATDFVDTQKVKPVIYPGEDGYNHISVNNVDYLVMSTLGRGGSSEVFCGFNSENKLHVAIKLVSLSDQTSAEGYINEVKLLESLQTCDRIIKMYDYEIQDDKLIVVLEKGGEDLSAILKQLATKQDHLPTYMLLFYWMEMLYAVKQIHAKGVIHSDLKPANFLRAEGGLKLIDFGIASKVQEDMTCVFKSTQEGSCNYISPEALSLQTTGNVDSPNYGKPKYKIHFKSDVWSLGCILYQLVYRKTPFASINQILAKLAAITDPNHKIPYPKADRVSPRLVNTIKKCLQYNTQSRPSVDELIDEYEQLLKAI